MFVGLIIFTTMKGKILMNTPQVGKDGDGMTRILWKKARRISTALILALTIIFSISCSNDSPDDSLVPLPMIGETFSCWPKGTYSGEVIESEFAPSSQSVIKILTAPIAAPDSLWPCVGHQVVVIRNQHEFHIGDTIVFEMTGRCERNLDLLNIWWVAIEIKE